MQLPTNFSVAEVSEGLNAIVDNATVAQPPSDLPQTLYQPGDLVFYDSHALESQRNKNSDTRWLGPYEVKSQEHNNVACVHLVGPEQIKFFHVSSLKLFAGSRVSGCAVCANKNNGKLWSCSKCKQPKYCGTACQREHWRTGHKRECLAFCNWRDGTLYSACFGGRLEELRSMVKLGGDVNYTISGISPQADGAYPLMAASQQGRLEILEELIKNKVDLEKPHKDGSRCVWGAAFMGLLGSLRVLLDGGADVNAINLTDGSAPLTAAVLSKLATKENLLAIVRLLIDRGADVHAVDYKGRSAFFESCATGNMDVIRHLFSVGAKYEQREREQGFTPFLKACQKGNHEAVLFLLEKGVDVHQHDNGGLFPLFMAAQGGHGRCVASLLEAGASVTQRRVTGATALFIAAHEGHVAVIRQLHEEGADVNARAIDCHTPLSIAVSEGRKDAVKTLLELGAEENYILRGSTMLGLAQRNGHSEIAALLRARQSQA